MSQSDLADAATGELLLDPFAYQPGSASAIAGLGGATPHQDPGYAFHTAYVAVAEGPAQFTVRFQGLSARLGTLQLRVHMFVDDANPRLLLANSLRIQFNRLIQLGSEVSVRFDGFPKVRFALYGNLLGQSDAQADAITVTLDRPADTGDGEQATAELRNSDFGHSATREAASLVAVAPPTLASPVCQAGTAGQAREPAFAEWMERIGRPAAADRAGWCLAYVLQALRSYGMLQPGAAGLGFGTHAEEIARGVEAMGGTARTATLPNMPEQLPGRLVNFDFLWSVDEIARAGVAESFGFVESLLKCLRPGGVAVHVVPFEPGLDQRAGSADAAVFHRGDVERLTLTMISRSIEAAQVRIECADALIGDSAAGPTGVGAFGLVFRKSPLAGG